MALEEKRVLGELLRTESKLREILKRIFDFKAESCAVTSSGFAQEINPHTGTFRNAEATEAAIEGNTYREVMDVLDKAAQI